jgi:hypothetical protein
MCIHILGVDYGRDSRTKNAEKRANLNILTTGMK